MDKLEGHMGMCTGWECATAQGRCESMELLSWPYQNIRF